MASIIIELKDNATGGADMIVTSSGASEEEKQESYCVKLGSIIAHLISHALIMQPRDDLAPENSTAAKEEIAREHQPVKGWDKP